jgi:hypothetical protein
VSSGSSDVNTPVPAVPTGTSPALRYALASGDTVSLLDAEKESAAKRVSAAPQKRLTTQKICRSATENKNMIRQKL